MGRKLTEEDRIVRRTIKSLKMKVFSNRKLKANILFRKLICLTGLLILLNSSIFPSSIAQSQNSQTTPVTFGIIARDQKTYARARIATKAIEDINNYMTDNFYPYNFSIRLLNLDFCLFESIQLNKTNCPKFITSESLPLLINSSFGYLNSNNMIFISSGETPPILSVDVARALSVSDNLFRLTNTNTYLYPALADIMWEYGIKNVIIFQVGNVWGNGVKDLFVPAWEAKGGEVARLIQYASQAENFANYLTVAEKEAATAVAKYDVNKVAVLLLGDPTVIMTQVKSYPTLCSIAWFNGGESKIQRDPGAPIIFSIFQEPITNSKYEELSTQYPESDPKLYDALWIYALSILKAGSTDTTAVKNILPSVAENYVGAGGPYILDKNGDQCNMLLDIWSGNIYSGQYDLGRNQMYWGVSPKTGTLITCETHPDSVLVQGDASISGSITPAVPNSNVNILITKSDGITTTTKIMTNSDGVYSTNISADSGGFWQVRATWGGNEAYYGATSQSAELYVRARVTEETIVLEKTAAAVGVPGFPWESVVLGVLISLSLFLLKNE